MNSYFPHSQKKYMKTTIQLLIIIISLTYSTNVLACRCLVAENAKDELKNVDIALVGTIISREEIRVDDTLGVNQIVSRLEMKFQLIVENTFKGTFSNDTVSIFTGMGGGDCGYNFVVGERYIVYADYQNAEDSTAEKASLTTSICTRTQVYNEEEIKALEEYRKSNH